MHAGIIASAIAARSMGYAGIAQLIVEKQLSPGAIARLFANGISRDRGTVCAIVLLAGSTARDSMPNVKDGMVILSAISPSRPWAERRASLQPTVRR